MLNRLLYLQPECETSLMRVVSQMLAAAERIDAERSATDAQEREA